MIKCVLTDIEGTTSSIEFVHKVLFPYSRSHMLEFLSSSKEQEVQELILKLWTEDLNQPMDQKPDLTAVTKLLHSWIDKDLKESSLKSLQGKIWKQGYESHAYFGHVYSEVKGALEKWKARDLKVAIYSSGSVEAQKLIFKHSSSGDLSGLIDNYFDTKVGNKRDPRSYATISEEMKIEPSEILFLSDISEELDAAELAGFITCQLLRDPQPASTKHTAHIDFEGVDELLKKLN